MATTVTEKRTEADVREDIAYYVHRAKRMTVVHPDYGLAHGILDELLRELGY